MADHMGMSYVDGMSASEVYNNDVRMLADFMQLPERAREAVGTAFNELIMECTYMGVQCNNELLFKRIFSPQYGTCFTFNSNVTVSGDALAGQRTTGLTGSLYSLTLLLYVKHYAYPPTLTTTKGVRIEIHPNDVSADVEENGIDIHPNTATSLDLEQMTIKRLPSPYEARCVDSWTQVAFYPAVVISNSSGNASNEKYNGLRCKKFCLQNYFRKVCSCFHPLFPSLNSFASQEEVWNVQLRPCLLIVNSEDHNCTALVQQQFDSGNITCDCPPSCFEITYNVFSSSTFWPRTTYMSTVAGRMGFEIGEMTTQDLDELATNVVEVKIFFKTLNTARLEQFPYISENSLMSALGGAMSLYLGISIIMLAEVLEYLATLTWNCAKFSLGQYQLHNDQHDMKVKMAVDNGKVYPCTRTISSTLASVDGALPSHAVQYDSPPLHHDKNS